MQASAETFLRRLFDAAVAAAQPALCVPPHLPEPPEAGRVIVVGAGKATAAMARAVEASWQRKLEGLVVVPYGHHQGCRDIEVVEAAHPVPDQAGQAAARRMLEMVGCLTVDDFVLGLFSGGGSALLPLPLPGLSLAIKQDANRLLLRAGATIGEINCVRRHLSAIKGGRLAAACHPASVLTLLISDVPGDDPVDIASGPMCADATTCSDALEIIDRYRVQLPVEVREQLEHGVAESVKPNDPRLRNQQTRLVATPQSALEASAKVAGQQGIRAHILSDRIEGEARDVAKVLGAIARQVAERQMPFVPPCVLLSGGETTVTVGGDGRGGRNVELLLALAIELDGLENVYALSADTDGIDGAAAVAGALIDPETLSRARQLDINPSDFLYRNDAHTFFERLGDQLVTGPTSTNVNDFRAILTMPADAGH
jgi:hydroxypyruvate reductase